MIYDIEQIVPCSHCHKLVKVGDAINTQLVTLLTSHNPNNGVWLFDSQACKDNHAIARQIRPILRRLPPVE